MAGGFRRILKFDRRYGVRLGLASLLLISGARAVQDASATGDTRTLSFHHTHSGEDLTVTFKRNGRYDDDALKRLNHFLRDWRTQDETSMDRRLFDVLWEVYRDVDGKQPIQIISAYRSPATNAMLRRRSAHSGVARFSQHMLGHAMDFYIPGVPLEQIRYAGLRLQRGGVGFYPHSGSPFVHLDVGNIRHWPRMTRQELARVFPDGRTVHIPADGNPMPGYQLALADIERRAREGDGSATKPGLLASLFSRKSAAAADDDDEASPAAALAAEPRPGLKAAVAAAASKVGEKIEKIAEAVPLPRAKPKMPGTRPATYQVASAAPAVAKEPSAEPVAATPADIITARGIWDVEPQQATPEQVAALVARHADPQPTASLPPRVSDAMAFAPPSPLDRAQVVAASAPIPHSARAAAEIAGGRRMVAVRARPATAQANEVWLRAMIVAPSASQSLSASWLGEPDMVAMRAHFVKPSAALAMTFTDDPQAGLLCERFTGAAVATLPTTTFVMRTASLR